MTVRATFGPGCMVAGCVEQRASWLGVCRSHWAALPPVLRREWGEAWHADARVITWLAVRRKCLDYLASAGG